MNRLDISKLLTSVSAAYPSFKLDEAGAIKAQWEYILKGFHFIAAEKALRAYIESGKDFPPHPGHIASILRRWELRQESVKSWEEGFKIAERLAKQFGSEHSKNAATAAKTISPRLYLSIKKFGYRTLCDLFKGYDGKAGATEDDIKYAKIKFEKIWREITEEVESTGYLGYQQEIQIQSSPQISLIEETAKQIRGIE